MQRLRKGSTSSEHHLKTELRDFPFMLMKVGFGVICCFDFYLISVSMRQLPSDKFFIHCTILIFSKTISSHLYKNILSKLSKWNWLTLVLGRQLNAPISQSLYSEQTKSASNVLPILVAP